MLNYSVAELRIELFRSHNLYFMFVANVTYYFEIYSWNLKKMRGRGEIYSGADYTDYAVALW